MKRKQDTCWCRRYKFPHREDYECVERALRESNDDPANRADLANDEDREQGRGLYARD